jgi:hypothetical protein
MKIVLDGECHQLSSAQLISSEFSSFLSGSCVPLLSGACAGSAERRWGEFELGGGNLWGL